MAQTCNSIGLPESAPTSKVKSTNGVNFDTTNTKLSKDEINKGCKPSNQPDSTSDTVESVIKNKDTPNKKSSDSQRANSTADDDGKRESASVSSSGGNKGDTSVNPVNNSESKNGNEQNGLNSLPSTSKCGSCIPQQTYPNLYGHFLPPTSTATGYPFSHAAPGLPISCYPSYQPAMSSFPRLCTDPFCKSCPPNPALAVSGAGMFPAPMMPCSLGCTQCSTASHPELSMWLNSYSSLMNVGLHGLANPGIPPMPAGYPTAPFNGATAAMLSAAANNPFFSMYNGNSGGHSGGHVCSWFSGEKYCGKVFPNAEELLQHLRGHTHETTNTSKSSVMTSPSPSHVAAAMAAASGRMSPRSTTYLNTLHSLRYHPYKLSPAGGPTVATSASLPHVAFSQLNPMATAYGLQSALFAGQRLPGSLPHP